MPWLEKGGTSTSDVAHAPAPNTQLLFVHIPRCGGTSLMKAHGLQEKILTGPDCPWYKQLFLNIFFSRYETFEKVNFPIWTQLNAGCLVLGVTGAIWLHLIDHGTTHYNAVAIADPGLVSDVCHYAHRRVDDYLCRLYVRLKCSDHCPDSVHPSGLFTAE